MSAAPHPRPRPQRRTRDARTAARTDQGSPRA